MVPTKTVAAIDMASLGDEKQRAVRMLLHQPRNGTHCGVGHRVGQVATRRDQLARIGKDLQKQGIARGWFNLIGPMFGDRDRKTLRYTTQETLRHPGKTSE
jgi:hypothetical protein